MSETAQNSAQKDYWTDQAGPKWVAQMEKMDGLLQPVLEQVLARAALSRGEQVIDVGCGAGTSTMLAAAQLGDGGAALGVDISQTLLATAKARANGLAGAQFLLADAQAHGFDPGTFDAIISRFGVMFFDDSDAAFTNLAAALRPGGRMVFATWGAIPNNPYFAVPAEIAREVIGPIEKIDPDLPGPFAFREPERVFGHLRAAGMGEIAVDVAQVHLTPTGDAQDMAELICHIGPPARTIAEHAPDAAQIAELQKALAKGLTKFQTGDGLRIPAEINFFAATKPA